MLDALLQKKNHNSFRDDIFCTQKFIDHSEISHLRVLLREKFLKVLLQPLHRTPGKHPDISKMLQEFRQEYDFPSIALFVRNWVCDCETCIKHERLNNTRFTAEIFHIQKLDQGSECFTQIDLLPELPPSGGYEIIFTAIDVFPRYGFAHSVGNPTAVDTAKFFISITSRHACLPTLFLTDKRNVFVSQVIDEVGKKPGKFLKHATKKHAQTIGVLERAHATIESSSKKASGEYRKQWRNYLLLQHWITIGLQARIPALIGNKAEFFMAGITQHRKSQTRTKIQSHYHTYYRLCRCNTRQNWNFF